MALVVEVVVVERVDVVSLMMQEAEAVVGDQLTVQKTTILQLLVAVVDIAADVADDVDSVDNIVL